MATYAIGDIQGCYRTFKRLLEAIDFDATRDHLWLVGDLVNRGPRSLDVLRWSYMHQSSITVVLGNHDLHLMAAAAGVRKAKRLDTLDGVLAAPDCDELLRWLRQQPFLHVEGDDVLVHAGVLPEWSLDDAREHAQVLEETLRNGDGVRMLQAIQSPAPTRWKDAKDDKSRLAFRVAVFTRMRAIDAKGALHGPFAGELAELPKGCLPWFLAPDRRLGDHRVIFGHWSALGLHVGDGVCALDTGCVWGRDLTAMRLDDGTVTSVPYSEGRAALTVTEK